MLVRYPAVATPPPIPFDVWVAALDSGYLPHNVFVAWADRCIDVDPYQPRWVLDLSLSRDSDEAQGILRVEWSRRSELPGGDVPPLGEPSGLHLGLLYLAHTAGRLSMEELLSEAGQYADGSGGGQVPECEAFYMLLNEIDGGGPTRTTHRPLADRVAELFAPMAAEARRSLRHLPGGPAAG
jgi:hypothetical protein